MKQDNILWNEFIYGGHWGSLAASAIALATITILNINNSWEFLIIAYLGSQCIYNYNHLNEIEKDKSTNLPRTTHLKKYDKNLTIVTALYIIIYFTLLVYFGNKPSIFFGGFLLLLGLFFTYRAKSLSGKIVGFKSIYIAFSWCLLPIFTAIYYDHPINNIVVLFSSFVFLRFMVDANFFDLKDIETDRSRGLHTLAVFFKNKNTFLNFLHIINILSFIPILYGIVYNMFPIYSVFLFLLLLYSIVYLQKAKSENADNLSLSYIIVDGEYYYWPFLLFLGILFIRG